MAAPLIVTVELGDADQKAMTALRTAHFPPERNQLAAHLTMFHAVPSFLDQELKRRLAEMTASFPPPSATLSGLMNLGGGVAYRVASDDLEAIRDELASAFRGSLTQQDSQGWRPHITVQNKVPPKVARELLERLETWFSPRPLLIAGLAYHHYEGGPWRLGKRYPFRG